MSIGTGAGCDGLGIWPSITKPRDDVLTIRLERSFYISVKLFKSGLNVHSCVRSAQLTGLFLRLA